MAARAVTDPSDVASMPALTALLTPWGLAGVANVPCPMAQDGPTAVWRYDAPQPGNVAAYELGIGGRPTGPPAAWPSPDAGLVEANSFVFVDYDQLLRSPAQDVDPAEGQRSLALVQRSYIDEVVDLLLSPDERREAGVPAGFGKRVTGFAEGLEVMEIFGELQWTFPERSPQADLARELSTLFEWVALEDPKYDGLK